jgi:hypothetical protein
MLFFRSCSLSSRCALPGAPQKSRQRLHAGGSIPNNKTPFKPLPSETGSHRYAMVYARLSVPV